MTLSNGEKSRAVGFNRGQLEVLVIERNDAICPIVPDSQHVLAMSIYGDGKKNNIDFMVTL